MYLRSVFVLCVYLNGPPGIGTTYKVCIACLREKNMNKYNLNQYNLSKWEIDILTDFNTEECLNDMIDMLREEDLEEFLSILADSINSYIYNKSKVDKK